MIEKIDSLPQLKQLTSEVIEKVDDLAEIKQIISELIEKVDDLSNNQKSQETEMLIPIALGLFQAAKKLLNKLPNPPISEACYCYPYAMP